MSEAIRETITTEDGYILDAETGEVLAAPGAPDAALTRADVEDVLARMQRAEARLAALKAQRQAIMDNMDRMEAHEKARQDWLTARYSDSLATWVRAELGDGKRRSIDTPYGRLGVRKVPGRIVVAVPDAALVWAYEHLQEAIVVKQTVSVAALKGHEDELPAGAFEVIPASERFYVSTGVKVNSGE